MPRPVSVMSPLSAVPLEPNGCSSPLPSRVRISSPDGRTSGTGVKRGSPSADWLSDGTANGGRPIASVGRPLSPSSVGGAALAISDTNTPADASRFAA